MIGGATSQTAIFWPVIAQVLLTFVAYMVMSSRRVAAVKAGEARMRDFAVPADPPASAAATRNVANQFELPVLFYVACLAFHQIGAVDLVALVLAWAFVVARVAHAWVHMTVNVVLMRRRFFIAGFVAVGLMWAWFAVALVTAQ